MKALKTYLRSLSEDHASGEAVEETSGYGALQNLLNTAGEDLSPRVKSIIITKNRGAGIPDGGLFTVNQLGRDRVADPAPAQLPERGAIEVKGPSEEVREIADSEQVSRYLERYGQVLVTNYREFLLVERGPLGKPVAIEAYSLAGSKEEFWEAAEHPERMAGIHGEGLANYLKRVMLRGAPLYHPRDLAWLLASYARDALYTVEHAELPALSQVRVALEQALGIEFEGDRGEHFFRSTLVQTLFYGVFSAWVLWSRQRTFESQERFDWRVAAFDLNVPMIRALFEQLVMPSRVKALGLGSILDRTGETLNRVDRAVFFERFDEEGAVQYFYEPFLEAFDPEVRKQFGVWYTPREVVHYMVERVDAVLREELDLADGLADPRVCVLDPCTGTGSYLVGVLRRIGKTLAEKGEDALAAQDLKRAATGRVFGFELLPAPFVVAHLQLGLLLQDAGAPLSEAGEERVGVYLTNALTGWEPPDEAKQRLPLEEFEEEREAAEAVKRDKQILVILGNPPYDGFANVAVDEERDLSTAYRKTKRAPAPKGQGLNNVYVRFFRMAERRIVEQTKKGVVCFISQYSWLDGRSHPGMRERYLEVFDKIWIDSLNGDAYRTGKTTPEGLPDPSVFSTESNPEGIGVGTAISLLVRKERHEPAEHVRFRNLWGRGKRAKLLATAEQDGESLYRKEVPPLGLGLPFMPTEARADYASWPLLSELFPTSFSGVKTSRDEVVVDIDRERLEERIGRYFDPAISHEEMRRVSPEAMESSKGFDAEATRERLQKRGLLEGNFIRYCYRPFDVRWLYWEPETKLLDRNRAEYLPHVFEGNPWIEARQKQPKDRFDRGYVTEILADNFGNGLSSYFPLYLKGDPNAPRGSLFHDEGAKPRPNLSLEAAAYLEAMDASAADLFYHTVAVLHSPSYRTEHAGALRQDWPRIALPEDRAALIASVELGREVAALLDVEGAVPGVTSGRVSEQLRSLARISRVGNDGRALDPNAGDLAMTAGWGYRGHNGAVMPGQGRFVERPYTPEERAVIETWAAALGLTLGEAFARLGERTYDIFLNEAACWENVPAGVWHYTAAGHRVVKKWLSYREKKILGRDLSVEEARYARNMVRRVAALVLLGERLDENYREIKADPYIWERDSG